jgi:hypothetical protein
MKTQASDILASQTTDTQSLNHAAQTANSAPENSSESLDRAHLVETISALCDCV